MSHGWLIVDKFWGHVSWFEVNFWIVEDGDVFNEMGLVLLRLVEVIGMDELEKIDHETLYFIISALNQLNIDALRNKIILKVLPLKV